MLQFLLFFAAVAAASVSMRERVCVCVCVRDRDYSLATLDATGQAKTQKSGTFSREQ